MSEKANSKKLDPKKTYAVVVGIDKYAYPEWNSKDGGPSESAIGFWEYLHRQGVQAQNAYLLLSALEDPRPLLGAPQVREPTRGDFRTLMRELRGTVGELLVVYWCGHGLLDIERKRRLLFADADKDDPLNLELEPFLAALSSKWFPGFRCQLLVIDACATPMWRGFTFDRPGERFGPGKPVQTRQASLFAVQELQAAKPGLLWKVLKPHLEAPQAKDCWPPDVVALLDELIADFEALRANQQPGFCLRDWTGQRDYRNLVSRGVSHLNSEEREQAAVIYDKAPLAADVLHPIYVAALPVPSMAEDDVRVFGECIGHVSTCDSPLPVLALALGIAAETEDRAVAAEFESWAEAVAGRLKVPDARLAEIAARFTRREAAATPVFQDKEAKEYSEKLAVIVHGTWAAQGAWWRPGGDFHSYLMNECGLDYLYNGEAAFRWSGRNDDKSRHQAAREFAEWVVRLGPRMLEVYAHDQGANVAMLATRNGLTIDKLVMMSPCVRRDYFADWDKVGEAYNIQSNMDRVVAIARGGRWFKIEQVRELELDATGHSASHDPKVWEENAVPAFLASGRVDL